MSTRTRQIAKVTALVAGGMIVGAGLGLLYAPQSGAETRHSLRRYAKRAQIQATKLGREVKARVNQAVEAGRSLVARDPESAEPIKAA